MKKYRYLSYAFFGLAILLSDVMCATVAYNYCEMSINWQIYSAPANITFLYAIPYGVGILICAAAGLFYRKRYLSSM